MTGPRRIVAALRHWMAMAGQREAAPGTQAIGQPGTEAEAVTVLQVGPDTDVAAAAERAPGRALLFVDPGVRLRDGALAAALTLMEQQADIGVVGGRVVHVDGTVQEAGRIVWATGVTTGYGSGLPADAGAVMARRDVDACSGGALLVRREAFRAVGGFDTAFPRGSTADAELCMRLRRAAWRVVYEPRCVVDAPEQVEASAADRQRLRAKHLGTAVAGRAPTRDVFARDAGVRKRLLVIDGFVPLRVMGAGYPRTQALLNTADAIGWAVTLFTLDLGGPGWANTYAELAPRIEVIGGLGAAGLPALLRERSGLYDVVLISRPETMQAVRDALADEPDEPGPWPGARLIYDAEAVFTTRRVQQAALAGTPLAPEAADALLQSEIALTQGADAVIAVTSAEAALFCAGQPAPVTVLSHPLRPRHGPDFAARSGFLFVGRLLERDSPNYDGLRWFVQFVWPGIRAALADAQLRVVGALHAEHADLSGPGIELVGPVPDLAASYDAARVFIAPTRFAAGVPIKVLEAGEAGLPTLTTGLIAAQLGWTPGRDLAAADDPAALAALGVALHGDGALWAATRARATARLVAEHGAERFEHGLRAVLDGPA